MTEKLNPCRKCGAKPRIKRVTLCDARVECTQCDQVTLTAPSSHDETTVCNLWNAANPIASQPAEKLDLAKFEGCTKGEWTQGGDGDHSLVCAGQIHIQQRFYRSYQGIDREILQSEKNANARLIAAAPDLLAEVRESRETIQAQAAELEQLNEEVKKLREIVELGRKVAVLAETTGGEDIQFEGSTYQAVEPEILDELANAGTQFMRALNRYALDKAKEKA